MKTRTARPGDKLFRKLCQKAGKTIIRHQMLHGGDHLLVGLSGGKDSNILLEVLADRKKSFPFEFKITAVHVRVKNPGMPDCGDDIRRLCDELNIPLIIKEIELDLNRDSGKSACYVCSWNKRKEIFNLSRALKCNKLAFGHHRDDALETMIMNMVYHGSISSLPYVLSMFNDRVRLIRPLMDIYETELSEYSRYRYPGRNNGGCPFADVTGRNESRHILENMAGMYPKAKINLFRAMNRIYPDYLPVSKI
jgi:tRNA(Ile)-lysidine synthase TilS/MesJ